MSNQPYLGPGMDPSSNSTFLRIISGKKLVRSKNQGHKMCKIIWKNFREEPDFRNPAEETCSAYHRKWNSAACGAWRFVR